MKCANYNIIGSSEGHSPVLNLSKTGGDHSGPASDHSAGGHTNVDDEDDLDEDDDNISDGEEDDIKDHGEQHKTIVVGTPITF